MARAAGPGVVVFGGVTRQNWPVVLVISPNARQLRLGLIGLRVSCTSGASFAIDDAFGALAISRRGKVHAVQSIPAVTTPNVAMTGGSHAISATLNRRRGTFTGSWRLQLNFREPNGQIDHCDSGQVSFRALL